MLPADTAALARFGPFTFDRTRGLLRRDDVELPLPPRVLGVLSLLVARAGEIVPRQELMDAVWKDAFVTDTSLAEAISALRQALGDDPQSPSYIQTVHRRGYRFIALVQSDTSTTLSMTPPFPVPAETSEDAAGPSIGMELLPWSIAVLTTLVAVVAIWLFTHSTAADLPVVRVSLEPNVGTTFDDAPGALAISPDATIAAWSGCAGGACRLYVRPLDRLQALAPEGTDGAAAPFFSPDGKWIGFFAGGKLKKIAVSGGAPVALADAPHALGATWLPDGSIVFASSPHGGLQRVPENGGNVIELTVPKADAGELAHVWPSTLPGGRTLLFTITTSPSDHSGRVAGLQLGDGWQTIVEHATLARLATPNYLAYSRGRDLHVVPFNAARLAVAGEDQVVLNGMAPDQFATSANGALLYRAIPLAGVLNTGFLAWVTSGRGWAYELRADGTWFAPGREQPVLSPDGERLAWSRSDDTATDVWVGDLERRTTTRLTHGGTNVSPVWSSDGSTVFYASSHGGPFEIWKRDAAASTTEQAVLSARERHHHLIPASASADGRQLAYVESGGTTHGDIGMLAIGGAARSVLGSSFDETEPALSRDGRWVAFVSDESGRDEVYLFNTETRQRAGVSTSGGTDPTWDSNGETLFYHDGPALMRITVVPSAGPVGPAQIVQSSAIGTIEGVSPEGRALLYRPPSTPGGDAVLTLEWIREIRRLLGPPATVLPR